jgi:hypothetical protein
MAITYTSSHASLGTGSSTVVDFGASGIQVDDVLIAHVSGGGNLPVNFISLVANGNGQIGYKVATSTDVTVHTFTFSGTNNFSICAIHGSRGVFVDGVLAAIDNIGTLSAGASIAATGNTTINWSYPQTDTTVDNELLFILMIGLKSYTLFGACPSPLTPSGNPVVAGIIGINTTGSAIRGSQGLAPNLGTVGPYDSSDTVVGGVGTQYTFTYTIAIIPLSPIELFPTPITESFNFAGGIGYRRRRRPFNPGSIDII